MATPRTTLSADDARLLVPYLERPVAGKVTLSADTARKIAGALRRRLPLWDATAEPDATDADLLGGAA